MLARVLASSALILGLASGAAFADGAASPPHVDSSHPVQVNYPSGARASGEEGAVDLRLQIDPYGRPSGRYQIIGTSGHQDLDTAALQSVLNWHYLPAKDSSGAPESGWITLHVDYKLPPEDQKPKQ